MKSKSQMFVTLCVFVLWCSVAATAFPTSDSAEHTFRVATQLACTQRSIPVQCQVLQFSRTQLDHNIAYYKAQVKVGAGDYDVIGLSRLIREAASGFPVHTVGSFLFLHGSSATFHMEMVGMIGRNGGLGVFLADRNIDVWGLDLRNVQIPLVLDNVSFAKSWGMDVQVNDTLLATRIARSVRALTGQDFGRVILGGHSSGAALTFATANAEAGMPTSERDVAGIIPIDMPYKLPPDATDQQGFSCFVSAMYRDFVDNQGSYLSDNVGSINMAQLAKTNPDGVSPDGAPLTNRQYLLANASALFFYPLYPFHPFAIMSDASGIPIDGRFSAYADIVETFIDSPVYSIPNAMSADMFGVSCPTIDSPYSTNLAKIGIPVLYVGVAGGMGKLGEYTMQLLGSHDVTIIMMQDLPDAEATNDFGHMEPFSAYQSKELVWQPLHAWVVRHSAQSNQ